MLSIGSAVAELVLHPFMAERILPDTCTDEGNTMFSDDVACPNVTHGNATKLFNK